MTQLYIGMMSGTSMDGVDGVLVDFADDAVRTIDAAFVPFPPALREQLMALQSWGENEIEREAIAANQLATCYAECAAALLPKAHGQVVAIGGLMRQAASSDNNGLPGASRVPVLGHLFGSKERVSQKRELVVLIKPTIVDGGVDWTPDLREAEGRVQELAPRPLGK